MYLYCTVAAWKSKKAKNAAERLTLLALAEICASDDVFGPNGITEPKHLPDAFALTLLSEQRFNRIVDLFRKRGVIVEDVQRERPFLGYKPGTRKPIFGDEVSRIIWRVFFE